MQETNIGIVLKRASCNKHGAFIITKDMGKIEIKTSSRDQIYKLWPGMIFSFNFMKKNRHIFFINKIDIIISPKFDCIKDIYWTHFLLGVCQHSLPFELPDPEAFELLLDSQKFPIFRKLFPKYELAIKKLYVLAILKLIGFYPNEEFIPFLGICKRLSYAYIDFDNETQVDSISKELCNFNDILHKLDPWILECLRKHPCFGHLKILLTNKYKIFS